MLPRLSRRQQAGLAVALALLLWLPQGISTHEQTVVTGHSTFYNGTTYDQCMASIAGIIRSQVMWFNDQVLVDRYAGKGTFIYVTENGSMDPTQAPYLYSEGVYYDFVDPNGAAWHVEEVFMVHTRGPRYDLGEGHVNTPDPTTMSDPAEAYAQGPEAWVGENRTYAWIVEVAATPIYDQFAGNDPHTLYNFLALVDTCKMRRSQYHGNLSHDTVEELSVDSGHPIDATAHEHETYLANLWVGKRPTIVSAHGPTAAQEWQSSWIRDETNHPSGGK